MGLIRATASATTGVAADQWRDYYSCDSVPLDTLVMRANRRAANSKSPENLISNGSIISVADGQCMILTEQGQVVELCAEPGEFLYDSSSEPTVFYGNLSRNVKDVFKNIGKRITFGGNAPKDQRIFYINTKEILGNLYGTANPVPFRVVDRNIGLDVDISITCYGEFSYRIVNPILFYTNVCGNVEKAYKRETIDDQLETELLTALQSAFAKVSTLGIRYSALPGHAAEMTDALNETLSSKWRDLRGIEVVSFGMSGVRASQEDERMIKELQRNAALRDPSMAAAHLVGAQSAAMQAAAANENGAVNAFMGMNMASNAAGARAENLFRMAYETGSGSNDQERTTWTCVCGSVNTSKFCPNCGASMPGRPIKIRCRNCGWESRDPNQMPKFCPECGTPMG